MLSMSARTAAHPIIDGAVIGQKTQITDYAFRGSFGGALEAGLTGNLHFVRSIDLHAQCEWF